MTMTSRVAVDMTPRPPIWIIARMTSSPKVDQWVAVSTVTRPVTQVAEVAVNSAVSRSVDSPGSAASGVIRAAVPAAITTAKPSMTVRAGFATRRFSRCVFVAS